MNVDISTESTSGVPGAKMWHAFVGDLTGRGNSVGICRAGQQTLLVNGFDD